ncbi:hypothetical protein Tco_0217091 [Tanacetum coccineum]
MDDAQRLEMVFSKNEVWEVIRGCGRDKAPGPDGFNFKFIRKTWEIIQLDLLGAIAWFWENTEISKECNASFVTIIPKLTDPIGLGDYHPISLIGCYYKIIAKLLAERVKRVVGSVVWEVQNASIKRRYILDGVIIVRQISSISIESSNVQPSEFPYLPVLCIRTSQSRHDNKSESQCQEQIKNEKARKQKESTSFQELNVKYFKIQDLQAQLQDKGIGHKVIPTTSVRRLQLKSNRLEDRVMHKNSKGKKQQVEDHRRNLKFSNNKTSVTACNNSLNAKTSNVNFVYVTYGKCVLNDNYDITRKPKRNVNQSVATSFKKTFALESTNQKPRSAIRKQYEYVSKTCKWWYSKITPPRYNWKPKTSKVNVIPNVSMPLGNKSRTPNILESIKLRESTLSNTPLYSNSFAARRDNYVHLRLWVLKAYDGKSQASK